MKFCFLCGDSGHFSDSCFRFGPRRSRKSPMNLPPDEVSLVFDLLKNKTIGEISDSEVDLYLKCRDYLRNL